METIELLKKPRTRCDCKLCKLSRTIHRTMKNGSHRQKNKLIHELSESLWDMGEERDMLRAAYEETTSAIPAQQVEAV